MASPKPPRCGGQEFHEQNEHYYRDSQLLNEEKIHTKGNWDGLNVILSIPSMWKIDKITKESK